MEFDLIDEIESMPKIVRKTFLISRQKVLKFTQFYNPQ